MAGLTVTGVIKKIGETKEFGENGFKKRAVLVEEQDGQFTDDIFAEFVKDKCTVLDEYAEGQEVTLDLNVKCKEHGGRYFTNLTAWRITAADEKQKVAATADQVPDKEEDIPF